MHNIKNTAHCSSATTMRVLSTALRGATTWLAAARALTTQTATRTTYGQGQ